MKPERDAAEEYFEYDAEEFLVSLTLLITEGRTPECSVKGRTEGLHCPPTQLTQPAHARHECSDKIPQCRQARRTRSEVMLLWRNNIPVMIEVMLLPDCCYSDEGPTTDGNDLNDPAIKQDALLLERWTMQPVPRQSGDRFIEEKTLLLAVRSYVFFSQLSAWLSASHGIVPRNILYRISAADEELVWHFSQPPAEHAFPVPNISHSVALKVRIQSLPRQPNYPALKCSIHTSLTFYEKRGRDQDVSRHRGQSSSPFIRPSHSPVRPSGGSSRINQHTGVLPPSKAAKLLYPRLTSNFDDRPLEGYEKSNNGAEGSKGLAPEVPVRAFKSLSLVEPTMMASPIPRPPLGETNPLIGSLLQERQEVIARIAHHLNYCASSTPHIPDRLFTGMEMQGPKSLWGPPEGEANVRKVKETPDPSYFNGTLSEQTPDGMGKSSASETPLHLCNKVKANGEPRPSPKLSTCRKLLLPDQSENSSISNMVPDISRLIQETIQQSQGRCNKHLLGTRTSSKEGTLNATDHMRDVCTPNSQQKNQAPGQDVSQERLSTNGADSSICTDSKRGRLQASKSACQENSHKSQNLLTKKLEATMVIPELKTSDSLHNNKRSKLGPSNSQQRAPRPEDAHEQNNFKTAENILPKGTAQPKDPTWQVHAQDENKDPSTPSILTSIPQRTPSQEKKANNERTPNGDVPRTNASSALKPCNIWKKQNRHSIDGTATKAFHPCTGLPLLSSPVPQRRTQTGCFDLDTSLMRYNGLPWASNKRTCLKRETEQDNTDQHQLSASAPPASLSLLGNFEECVLNYRLEPLGTVEGFTAEVGASGMFCPSHMTLPVDVSFYSVSDDNAPSPYMTLFNPNKTVVKMFVVIYDLREMPANHQTFLRQRTFSVPVKREANGYVSKKPLPLSQERTLRYLIHLRFQSSKSGKIYLHRDIRLLFSRKSMEVDSGAAYELKSFTESPADPPFSPRC
ncbi:protein FAM214A-like [Arapaima gigas]